LTRERAPLTREQAPLSREQAPLTREQAPLTREQAPLTREQAPLSRERAFNIECERPRPFTGLRVEPSPLRFRLRTASPRQVAAPGS